MNSANYLLKIIFQYDVIYKLIYEDCMESPCFEFWIIKTEQSHDFYD